MGTAVAAGQITQPEAPTELTSGNYQPINGSGRFHWFMQNTVGPTSLGAGLFTAAVGTARNRPVEYGPHWDGFGKRYGMRLTGVSTGNAMEASLGAIWGEDPRYFRLVNAPFKERVGSVVKMTFLAHNRFGNVVPAYARYVSTPSNNFLSNTWRADSEATNRAAALRTLWGFLGLMGRNAFEEFWPDVRHSVFHRQH